MSAEGSAPPDAGGDIHSDLHASVGVILEALRAVNGMSGRSGGAASNSLALDDNPRAIAQVWSQERA